MKKVDKFFNESKFVLYRKYLTIGCRFYVYSMDGTTLFYGIRDPYRIHSDFHIYIGGTSDEYLRIEDNSIKDYNTKYKIFCRGNFVGSLKKDTKNSILRHKWFFYDTDDKKIGIAEEDSWVKALFRRFVNIPLLSIILKSNVLVRRMNGEDYADISRMFSFFDKYSLNFFDTDRDMRKFILVLVAIIMDITSGR